MHIPVLLNETIELLQPQPGQHFIDATVGGGGHSAAILERTGPDGRLLAIDRDDTALATAQETLAQFGERVTYVRDSFANLRSIADEFFPDKEISGILLDLGISSIELDDPERGFTFQQDGPLDMRMDTRSSTTAADIVNTWPAERLQKVFREYGNEPLAPEITRALLTRRQQKQKIKTTKQLVAAILSVYREKLGSEKDVPWIGGIHPATRVFQALRIAVNDEYRAIEQALPQAVDILRPGGPARHDKQGVAGGRLAIISFHSGEDRMVKRFIKRASTDCICPPELPACICDHTASLTRITKKPVVPTAAEIKKNNRSRSAKLRVAEKIEKNT